MYDPNRTYTQEELANMVTGSDSIDFNFILTLVVVNLLVCGIVAVAVAHHNGRSMFLGFLSGFFFGQFGIMTHMIMGKKQIDHRQFKVVLQDNSVTFDKLGRSSFGASSVTTGSNLTNAPSGTVAVTTSYNFVIGRTYLILFQTQQSSGDGSIWYQELRINGVAVSTSRFGGSTNTQMSAPISYVHVAASTSTTTVAVATMRASGTGNVNVEIPRLSVIPLMN